MAEKPIKTLLEIQEEIENDISLVARIKRIVRLSGTCTCFSFLGSGFGGVVARRSKTNISPFMGVLSISWSMADLQGRVQESPLHPKVPASYSCAFVTLGIRRAVVISHHASIWMFRTLIFMAESQMSSVWFCRGCY